MKAIYFTCWFVAFACCSAVAQPKPTTLTGVLVMQTGETFPYKVVLTDSGDFVSGYSFTYKEPDETKTTVHGRLDRHMRTLSFKEKDIVYSHNVSTKAFMCLVDAHLEYVGEAGGYVLKGPVMSKEADNTACTQGEITFSNTEELQNLFAYHEHFDTVISMKRKVKQPDTVQAAPIQVTEPVATEQVTAGVDKMYDWHSDSVIIEVWDGGYVDGDRITLKAYLTNYCLVKEKRRVSIPISGHDINTITVYAENEGSEPPNTASIMLTDGSIKYSIQAYNKKGDEALIKVRKVN